MNTPSPLNTANQEKVYLSLAGHEGDRVRLNRLIDEADGDLEKFKVLYEARFSMRAVLYTKDITKEEPENFLKVV